MKLSLVVCAQNQRDTIQDTLNRLWAVASDDWQVEVVTVDNHSTDGTRELLMSLETANLQVIYQARPRAAASCWRAAIPHLTGDYCLLPGNPSERTLATLPGLMRAALNGGTALYSAPDDTQSRSRLDLVTDFANLLFGGHLADLLGAAKLVRAETLKALNLHGDGPRLEIDLTAKLLRAGLDIRQVPSAAHHPSRTRPASTLAALGALIGARLNPEPVWKSGQQPSTDKKGQA